MNHFEEMPDYADLPQGPKGYVPIEEMPSDGLAPDELIMEMERLRNEGYDDFKVLQAEDDGVPEAWRDDTGLDFDRESSTVIDEDPVEVTSKEAGFDKKIVQEAHEERQRTWHDTGRYESYGKNGRNQKERPKGPKLSDFEQEA